MNADAVIAAFRLRPEQRAALQRDALPTAFHASTPLVKIIFWVVIILFVLLLVRCSQGSGAADCRQTRDTFGEASQEYQSCLASQRSGTGYHTGGGAFGGFSSGGGGHK